MDTFDPHGNDPTPSAYMLRWPQSLRNIVPWFYPPETDLQNQETNLSVQMQSGRYAKSPDRKTALFESILFHTPVLPRKAAHSQTAANDSPIVFFYLHYRLREATRFCIPQNDRSPVRRRDIQYQGIIFYYSSCVFSAKNLSISR